MTGKADVAAGGIDPARQRWHRSGTGEGSVEVAFPDGGQWVLVRVAGDRDGRVLVFGRHEWLCFLDGARKGEFNDAAAP